MINTLCRSPLLPQYIRDLGKLNGVAAPIARVIGAATPRLELHCVGGFRASFRRNPYLRYNIQQSISYCLRRKTE